MPSEAPTLATDDVLDRIERLRELASSVDPREFFEAFHELLSLNSALMIEVIGLRKKCDELVKELFKQTWNRPSGTTGMTNFGRSRP